MRSNAAIAWLLSLSLAGSACATVPSAEGSRDTPAPACDPQASDREGYCSYPADVRAFVDDRDACDHWRGEPWATDEEIRGESDPAQREALAQRRKDVIDAMNASCAGTDKRLEALKAAYASDPKILQLLDEYETGIEAGD